MSLETIIWNVEQDQSMYNLPLHPRVESKNICAAQVTSVPFLLQSVKHHLSFLSGTSFENSNFNSFQKFGRKKCQLVMNSSHKLWKVSITIDS